MFFEKSFSIVIFFGGLKFLSFLQLVRYSSLATRTPNNVWKPSDTGICFIALLFFKKCSTKLNVRFETKTARKDKRMFVQDFAMSEHLCFILRLRNHVQGKKRYAVHSAEQLFEKIFSKTRNRKCLLKILMQVQFSLSVWKSKLFCVMAAPFFSI